MATGESDTPYINTNFPNSKYVKLVADVKATIKLNIVVSISDNVRVRVSKNGKIVSSYTFNGDDTISSGYDVGDNLFLLNILDIENLIFYIEQE